MTVLEWMSWTKTNCLKFATPRYFAVSVKQGSGPKKVSLSKLARVASRSD